MAGKMLIVDEKSDATIRKLVRYTQILNERYLECDREGHKKSDTDSNMCNYCYRHLNYETPETDSIRKSREGVPPEYQPLDAVFLLQNEKREIDIQETHDFYQSISKLRKELEKEVIA